MQRTVIVYGAAGVGKAPIAEALASALDLQLVDEWNGREPVPPGSLVVTNIAAVPMVPGALYVEVKKAP
jgi:MoxR-like ATPase